MAVIAEFNPDLIAKRSCGDTLMFRFCMVDLYESVQIHELDNESVEKVQLKSGTHVRMLVVVGSDNFPSFTYCR